MSNDTEHRTNKLRAALRAAGLSPPPVAESVLEDAIEAAGLDPDRYVVTSPLSGPKGQELRDGRVKMAAHLAREGSDPGYRIDDFREDVDAYREDAPMGLADMPPQLYGRFEVLCSRLIPVASYWPPAEVEEAKAYLRENGARARHCRDWKGAVARTRKEREQGEEEDDGDDPSDLKSGEITAWIVDEVQSDDHFAVGQDGGLYYYENGCYHDGGERYLNQRVTEILKSEDMVTENTSYRRNEVQELIEITAPRLWETPPRDRLCLLNGILNLDTGQLEDHGPEKWLSTRQIPIEHDPTADGEQWANFLSTVFPGDDPEELAYEVMAYLLLPPKGRRRAIHLHGPSNTGKSTFIRNFVEGVMGESTVQHWTLQDLDENDFAAATLLGTTLNVCADLPSRPMEGTSVFKRITGGDRMTAQRKYEDPFTFTPACHMLFSGNGPIVAPDAGDAFWSRWNVIPFETEVGEDQPGHVPREQLDAALQDPEELSALLNELLRVLDRVRTGGVEERPCMTDAVSEMRGHPENDLPGHAGDGAARQETPQKPPHPAVSEPKRAQEPGDPPAKNFEKETDSDTGGVCVREGDAAKSFSEGEAVRLPDGQIGEIVRQVGTDPPEYAVRVAEGEAYACTPDELESAGDDPEDEAPF